MRGLLNFCYAVAACLFAISAPAYAQPAGWKPWAGQYHPIYKDYPINNTVPAAEFVTKKTVDGCLFYETVGVISNAEYQENMRGSKITMTWTGPKCERGKPISGVGTMREDNKNFYPTVISYEFTGELKNGYWDGSVKGVNVSNGRSSISQWRGGCRIWKNDDGTPSMSPDRYCRPVDLTGYISKAAPAAPTTMPLPAPQPQSLAAARAPILLVPVESIVTAGYYPGASIEAREEGDTGIDIYVDATGAVTECRTTSSSGYAILDTNACKAYTKRAKFSPATDTAGNPTAAVFHTIVRWRI